MSETNEMVIEMEQETVAENMSLTYPVYFFAGFDNVNDDDLDKLEFIDIELSSEDEMSELQDYEVTEVKEFGNDEMETVSIDSSYTNIQNTNNSIETIDFGNEGNQVADPIFSVKCKLCGARFKDLAHMQKHIRLYHSRKADPPPANNTILTMLLDNLQCRECGQFGFNFLRLQNHLTQTHSKHEFYLNCCHEKFKHLRDIRSHLARYHACSTSIGRSGNIMEIPQWNAIYSLQQLDSIINLWKPYLRCSKCLELFSTYTQLQFHFRQIHPNEVCEIECCSQRWNQIDATVEHIRSHLIEAGKQISENTNLEDMSKKERCYPPELLEQQEHNNSTASEKEIEAFIKHYIPILTCWVCSMPYSCLRFLENHFFLKHPKEEFYFKCCESKMNTQSKIEHHIRLHLTDKTRQYAACDYLGENNLIAKLLFSELDDFIAIWRPKLSCYLCEMYFPTFSLVQLHFTRVHSTHTCYILCCDQTLETHYQIEEHIQIHNNPKGFKCHECPRRFIRRSSLYCHSSKKHPIFSNGEKSMEAKAKATKTSSKGIDKSHISAQDSSELEINELILSEGKSKETKEEVTKTSSCISIQDSAIHKITEFILSERKSTEAKEEAVKASSKGIDKSHISIQDSIVHEINEFIKHYIPYIPCYVCDENLYNFFSLRRHFDIEHPNEECYLLCCERKLCTLTAIDNHIHLHMANKNYKSNFVIRKFYKDIDKFIAEWRPTLDCPLCEKSFSKFKELEWHFLKCHNKYQCFIVCCDQKLETRQQIDEHIYLHANPKGFKCQCHEWYTNRSSLYRHMCMEHPLLAFVTKNDDIMLKLNLKTTCGECNRSYPSYTHLENHFSREHPQIECYFMCCGWNMIGSAIIESHLLTHVDSEKKKREKSYKELDDVIAQWRPNLECVICRTKGIPTFTLLKLHFYKTHRDAPYCYITCCGLELKTRPEIKEHILQHNASES